MAANRNFPSSRLFTAHMKPVKIDLEIPIGASGAVGTVVGQYVSSVTRLNTGIYQIQLQDPYVELLGLSARVAAPAGSSVNAGSFVTGSVYQILTVGTTDFHAIGLQTGVTPAPGVIFKATGAGSGTGTAAIPSVSGVASVEMIGAPNTMTANLPGQGALINIQCLAATSSSVTTLIPADPANGSTIFLELYLNDSQVQ